MTLGKSIRIYLKEGTVSGIKQAEVVNHTIQALSSPRNKFTDLHKNTKASKYRSFYVMLKA